MSIRPIRHVKPIRLIVVFLVLLSLSAFVYFKYVQAATNCWTGAGATENWSETANWSLGVAPGVSGNTTNLATFGSASCASGLTKNVTIDTNIDVSGTGGGILISATTNAYTGIITQGTSTITIGTGNYSQSAGTFTGGSGTITINGSYSLTGGTFTSTSGTMTIAWTTFTISGSPIFSANSGTVTFTAGTTIACNNVTFNTVIINRNSNNTFTVGSDCNLPLGASPTVTLNGTNGNLILNGTLSGTGTLTISSNVSGNTFTMNSGAVLSGFTGFTSNMGVIIAGATTDFSSYSSGVTLQANFTISSGSFTAPPTLTFSGAPSSTLSCNNASFNTVVINKSTNGTLTIGSNCNLPLGASPTVTLAGTSANLILNGTLSGTGTLTFANGGYVNTITLNSGASLSGFNSLVVGNAFTVAGATLNLGSYTTVDLNNNFALSSGTFTAPSGTMTVAGSFTVSGGTFNANSGTVTLDSSTNMSLSCGSATLNGLTINKGSSGVTNTLTSNCTVGNFTLTQGTMSNPASAYTLSVTGNFTQNANTAFGGGNLTVAMTGSSNQTYTRSTGTFVSLFTVNKTSGTVTLANSLNTGTTSTGQACNITSGTLSLASYNLVCSSLTVANGGNFQLQGGETYTTPTLNSGSTVTFTGSGSTSYTLPNWSYSNLTLNSTSGTNTWNLGADLTTLKSLTISAGTFDATASLYNVTIGGNFTQNGTMTARNNTFTFNDASGTSPNSIITGTSGITFYNLTSTTASKILKFGAGKTFRINGLFTVTGTANNPVNLGSATPMTQWIINKQGTSAITYAFVQDGACDGTSLSITLDGTSRNGGNNGTCWGGYPGNVNPHFNGSTYIRGNVRIGN
ncbi:hypothetical protein A3J19_01730 [Candidatus Daviesbacteria bacterium RIFCSPLOWO2_02_FULL_41_8]|uniref:G8 domain-containing protein n=2 Tax=Candidatus Daviesiibacteriota TaxID=1752718 RepID=A0A1F5NM09_9BACT|nr:MAG: hypothetical protein A3D83_04720 [Candidatus Daviesbacteria bacterium RIFCSPHIGHO2_02_FULL_41_10]OGE78719.1 MAG: hypothetical protein A3J19_01730 [Candidatus Daviesbacteria bacterium RIFCSPLOWO2_02_FULL_41_8]